MSHTTPYVSRRQQNWGRNQNTTRYVSNVKLGPVAHTVLVALMITVLGLIYLTQAVRTSDYDYAIDEVNAQIDELAVKKDDLEIENARLTSLKTVQGSDVASRMVEPVDTEYTQ